MDDEDPAECPGTKCYSRAVHKPANMGELKDDLLEGKTGYQAKPSESAFSDIPKRNIEVVAAYLQLIVDITNPKKGMVVLDVFNNARTIFSDDHIKETDSLWKEHVAGTLRESLDIHLDGDMQMVLRHLPKRGDGDTETANFYKEVQDAKGFLNDLAHMRYVDVAKYVKDKYSLDESVLTESTFNRVCKDLIDRLYAWFCKHCYKGT